MVDIKVLIIAFALTVYQIGIADVPDKLFISVYYESACPDSTTFILNQLQPAVNLLHDHLILRLIPFGKSRNVSHGEGGFRCQHGPAECFGNMFQDCTLDLMTYKTDVERVTYVACEMRTGASTRGDYQCVNAADVPAKEVNDCMTSSRGTMLQLDSEHFTKLLHLSFVPTVTIDDVFNQQIQDSSQEDFIGTLCSILKNTNICANYYNSRALHDVLL